MIYGFSTLVVTNPTGTDKSFLIASRPKRVSLIVSSLVAATLVLSTSQAAGNADVFWSGNVRPSAIVTFRDFGPLIQMPIFFNATVAGAFTVSVTEVYALSRC